MKICTVVGARPQFIKSAVVSPALAKAGIVETVVHTGQHYDSEMSDVFFRQLNLRTPARNLGVGSGSHAAQTAGMLTKLADAFLSDGPFDGALVYGDTNSTLAASLVAAKLHVPLFHVEAGLRSYNRKMPEEHNRVIADRLSALLFCPSARAADNLKLEGIVEGVHVTGDVMYEVMQAFVPLAEKVDRRTIDSRIDERFYLATLHRPSNVDSLKVLQGILDAFGSLDGQVLMPTHPRTAKQLSRVNIPDNVLRLNPLGYVEMLSLLRRARCVLTDSGGLQKEAFWTSTPCVTIRDETEWLDTLADGWNQLTGSDPARILAAVAKVPTGQPQVGDDGIASEKIVGAIRDYLAGGDE